MSVVIEFEPEEEARLRERATAIGTDVRTFVRQAALEKADLPSLADLLAPIHAATEMSGISVDDIDAMADRARREARQSIKQP